LEDFQAGLSARCLNPGFTTLETGQAAFTASEPDRAPNGMNCGQTRIERLMLTMTGAGLQIDSIHARAICEEIGERLRTVLRRDAGRDLPPRLRDLMEQLAKADEQASPSIVPSLDEMLMSQHDIARREETSAALIVTP